MLKNPLPNAKLKKWPKGNVFQWYGENPALYTLYAGIAFHNGIDIGTYDGDLVVAAHDGEVVEVFNAPKGYGHHIRVVSDKFDDRYIETIYGHLREDMLVKVGDKVKGGETYLGMESNSGFVVSNSTPFWGNAPAGKGVHLHFGVRYLTDVKPNTYQVSYSSGYSFSVINNVVNGYIDPMKLLNMKLKLVKEKNRNAVYAIISGKYYWISAEAMGDLTGEGLASWEDVVETEIKIELDGVIK